MTLLCFLLDLRTIPPSLLRDLKQCFLQLANLYAVSNGRGEKEQRRGEETPLLRDQIGLCYLRRSRSPSSSTELKIAYKPGKSFCLRDFHHAVNNLPMDSFVPELTELMHIGSDNEEVSLANLFSTKALYSWGGDYAPQKVIIICTTISTTAVLRETLMDAAEKCIAVEFVVLELEEQNQKKDVAEKSDDFINNIHDLENCVLQRYLPDAWVLSGMVKRWSQELRNDLEEPLQAVFLFRNSIFDSTDQIYCNLFASANQIIDGFPSYQTCRCHGCPVDAPVNSKKRTCPLTCPELGASHVSDNAVRVGEQTVLFLPSFEGCPKLQRISAPIIFNVIERTNLTSLNEGVVVGKSYVVTPSSHEKEAASDECDKSDLNCQLFRGLCGALSLLDQGLVCSSTCNTETMMEGTFRCFYVLQPSERGPMLLRRLAGSEEILPIPDTCPATDLAAPEELRKSIQASLSKIELIDYNPLQHERGLHPKLNWLVKESLQFGSIPPQCAQVDPKLNGQNYLHSSTAVHPSLTQAPEEEICQLQSKDEKSSFCVTGWEQLLIVDEENDSSPTCTSKPKVQSSRLAAQTKPLDEKTLSILERLESPKSQKPKATSPSIASSLVITGHMKKPLVPFDVSSCQPLKPNFQRLKRKQR